jgi:hypothetical protein
VEQDERLRFSFGAAAAAYAEHRPDYARAAVRWALERALAAYGYRRDQLGLDLRRRLLAWGILHRYSNLRWWIRRLPAPARPTLDALADRWFATE